MSNQKPIIVKRCYPIPRHRNSLLKTFEQSNHIEMPVRRVVSKASNNEMQEAPTCVSDSSTGASKLPDATTNEDSSRCRISVSQLEFLAHCMERFPGLALSTAKSHYDRIHAFRKWNQIANALNKIEPRAARTGKKWLRYWTDQKFKTRRLLARSQQRSLLTGEPRKPLSPFQERLLRIISAQENGRDDQKYKYSIHEVETVPTEQVDVISALDITVKEEVEVSGPEAVLLARSPSPTPEEVPQEDPIGVDIGKPSMEDLQAEILKFNLQKQKEMHNLEMSCMKERHKLEMEILELKKRRLLQELEKKNSNHNKEVTYGISPKYYVKS